MRACSAFRLGGLAAALLLAATAAAPAQTKAPSKAPAKVETCKASDAAAIIDQAGAALRQLTAETQPRMQARLRQLAQQQGWSEAEAEERGYDMIEDEEVRRLDEQAGTLLLRLDQLGNVDGSVPTSCAQIAELRTTAAQLVEVTTAKSVQMSARLDAVLRQTTAAAVPPQPPAVAPPAAAPAPRPAEPPKAPAVRAEPKPEPKPEARPPAPPAVASWGALTTRETAPTPGTGQEAVLADPTPSTPPEPVTSATYSADDIRSAGRGFFGSLSAELAAVMEHAFRSYGSPTGYILGTEGGGAFIAGLRYGQGRLALRSGEQKVYWQGPSFGTDLGVSGSRVMFLVYNVDEPGDLMTRFGGVEGSAYVVGGVGITYLKKGSRVLAPIRTGLGVRIGASVGYLKFTARPSFNPF